MNALMASHAVNPLLSLSHGWRRARLEDLLSDARAGFAAGQRDPKGVVQIRMNNVTTSGTWDWSS
jgi:hypothetical protein